MIKIADFLGTMSTNPFYFCHYDLNHFSLYVSGKQVPPEGLTLDKSHEKIAIMGYRTLFEGSGIHHSNTGLQITPAKYINGYFMLVFDLTPDLAASEGHNPILHTATFVWDWNLQKLCPTLSSAYCILSMIIRL